MPQIFHWIRFASTLGVAATLCSTVDAIVIGENAPPEEQCAHYKESPNDFKECVQNVRDEIAAHERFVQQPKKDAAARASEVARRQAARKACLAAGLRLGSVRIGMESQEVRDCGWGRPASIRRTTTATRTTEQWVYGTGNYLYFENGKLVAIQN